MNIEPTEILNREPEPTDITPSVETSIDPQEWESVQELISSLVINMESVIKGKHNLLELLVTGLLAGGHVLIEDVPGTGKTTLGKTLAHLISKSKQGNPVNFKRIQFTPDLLPYDITGVDIYDQKDNNFKFSPGPVFSNIILADEINRTTPKVQSALLEVMAENQVTVGNKTHKMDILFFVIATQNPVETEGTFPLPAAQLDRFLMKLHIGYPDEEEEIEIVSRDPSATILPALTPVCGKKDIVDARDTIKKVYCDPRLIRLGVRISAATRKHKGIELGASPRASLMLIQAAKAYAAVKKRNYVIDQDILDIAPMVLTHRLKFKDIRIQGESIVRDITLNAMSKIKY